MGLALVFSTVRCQLTSMKRIIRPAMPTDLPEVATIYGEAVTGGRTGHQSARPPEHWQPLLQGEHAFDSLWVAEEGEAVVGWLSVVPYRLGRAAFRHSFEVSYYVLEARQGRGVATSLLQHCVEQCPQWGVRTLLAIVLANNEASIRFLERAGFDCWARLPGVADFDGIEVDHVYYGRRINPPKPPVEASGPSL